MSENKFSIEYLFRECVMKHHCILLRLYEAIQWNESLVDEIYLVDICVEEDVKKLLIQNITNTVNTYGEIRIKAFALFEGPYEAKVLTICTNQILEIEIRKTNY